MLCLNATAQVECKEIVVSITYQDSDKEGLNGSLKIDLKGQSPSSVVIHLVGPKKYFKKDINEKEVTGLKRGTYTLVFSGRREQDTFCQKHFQFVIR